MPTPLDLQPLLSRVLALWRALVAGLARILSRWLGARPAPAGDVLAGLDAKLRPSGERPMLTPSGLPRRKGGTFTAAPPPRAKRNLTGGLKALDEDELRAVQHDSRRRKDQARALEIISRHRKEMGAFKVQKLAALPRTFAPEALKAFRAQFPEVGTETLQRLVPLIAPLSGEVCDKAAVHAPWREDERDALLRAVSREAKEKLAGSIEALLAMSGPARQALLRLPRAPQAAHVEELVKQWKALDAAEIRAMAMALAQFTRDELQGALREGGKPVKISPTDIRG